MSRRSVAVRPASVARPAWLAAALALGAAIAAGIVIARVLMDPPSGDLRDLAIYLAISGAATVGVGWLALRAADRVVGLPLQTRAFLGALIGSGVALVNVLIVARLMFVSTSHDLQLLIALLAFSGIVTVFFSLWTASEIAGHLQTVESGVHALAAGEYTVRIDVDARNEIGALAADVNRLADRLRRAEEERATLDRERKELTAAISHDLRTPLASVRAMVEALDDGVVGDADEIARYYAAMRREIERLNRLIDDLFDLARIDAGALKLDRRAIALQEVSAEVVDAMQAQARNAGVGLRLIVEGDPSPVLVDGALIERAVANLVRNALEHTPEGGSVDVVVAQRDGSAEVGVRDTGPGIVQADLPHLWERFYRAEKSRRRSAGVPGGAGLGLAIVRGVAEAHGGEVEARSVFGQGATFTIRLPMSGTPR